jgi:transcriptional regulator with XRE-family HTH domain
LSVLGDRLKEQRIFMDWTQEEVAKKLGLNYKSTYSRWEHGFREPSIRYLIALADLYGVSIDYLTGRTDKNQKKRVGREFRLGFNYGH